MVQVLADSEFGRDWNFMYCCRILDLSNFPSADNSTTINEIQEIDSRMFSIKEAVIIAVSLTLIQAGIYGANLLLGIAA